MTRSTTLSAWWAVNAPAWRSIASTRVVLPWSTCATIATLRRFGGLRASDMGVRRRFRRSESARQMGLVESTGDPRAGSHRRPRGRPWLRVTAMPTIATNTRVERDELLDFVRTRHHLVLVTHRADGSPQLSPVTGGVDADGRIVISTYPDRPRPPTCAATRGPPCSSSPTSGTTPGSRSTAPPRCSTCPARRPRTGWSTTSAASPASTPTGTSTARRCASRASRWSGSPSSAGDRSPPAASRPTGLPS